MSNSRGIMINLIEKDQAKETKRLGVAVIVTLLLFVLAGMGFIYRYEQIKLNTETNRYQELMAREKSNQTTIDSLQDLREFRQELNRKRKLVLQVENVKTSHLHVLAEVEKAIPAGVVLVGIDIQEQRGLLHGTAPNYTMVASFLSGLRESVLFKDVEVVSSSLNEESQQVNFSIEADWGENHP